MARSRRSSRPRRSPKAPPVAIVGMACRFPGGAVDLESFWSLLIEGRNAIREIPADRWSVDRYYHPDPAVPGTMTTRWGGFVDDLAGFDRRFWGISPREAARMDPQQRWLLEVAWEAIEDAGVAPRRLRGRPVGVFVGISGNDYGGLQLPNLADVDAYTNSGSTLSIASNRISYALDLKGPSLSVDTACSSASVALWMACQSLASGACEAALVGGVNALITPHATVGFSKASMVSPTGQCFAFDARANGYVRAEGAGVVLLKPLAAAVADGDRIYAVIRGGAVNQDGHTSSMTVPSVEGQAAMLRAAYAEAGVAPTSVVYVEAHGTGTPVGDPIEAGALGRVLGRRRPSDRPCLIGSVKTNIGHLEAGAGIAGLIKAALVLHRRTIPPSLNYATPNPEIPFSELRLAVVSRLQPLPSVNGAAPVVGVNSFGFGGTNAHIVLQAPPVALAPAPVGGPLAERPGVLPISARDETALRATVARYCELLAKESPAWRDVAAAAGARKDHHEHRLVAIGDSPHEMREVLGTWLRHGQAPGVVSGLAGPATPLTFVFTGQGAQWAGMGRHLYEREPVFRRAIDRIDVLLQPRTGWSLVAALCDADDGGAIDRTDIAQPAIFAVQVGLVDLWASWGIRPAAVVGHSVGEVAAAWTAGILSLEDAVTLIFHRGVLMHRTIGAGRMLVLGLSARQAEAAIGEEAGDVELAGINSPHLVTLAGEAGALGRVAGRLEATGVFMRWLRLAYAFHSRHMEPIREDLLRALAAIRPRRPTVLFVSTVTGKPIGSAPLDGAYWWNNIRRAVLFEPAIAGLIRDDHDAFLEVGPHPALRSALGDCLAAQDRRGPVLRSLQRDGDGSRDLLATLASMHLHGISVDWRSVNQSRGPVMPLPRYAWTRESFWLESSESARQRLAPVDHPFLAVRVPGALPTWRVDLDVRRFPYLADHRVLDGVVFPAAGYGEIGLALARVLSPGVGPVVEGLEIKQALFVDERRPATLQVVFDPADKRFQVFSSPDGAQTWELHAEGTLTGLALTEPPALEVVGLRDGLTHHYDHDRCYVQFASRGYAQGPTFQQIRNLWRGGEAALAEIEAPRSVAGAAGYIFHPALQDACLQAIIGTGTPGTDRDELFLPRSIGRLCVYRDRVPGRLWAHARRLRDDGRTLTGDVLVYDDDGRRVADILGFHLERMDRRGRADRDDDSYYRVEWEPRRLWGSGRLGPCAFVPTAEIVSAVQAAVPALVTRHELEAYHGDYVPDVRRLAGELIVQAFAELGWKPEPSDSVHFSRFAAALGIAAPQHGLARILLGELVSSGWLSTAGPDAWKVIHRPQRLDPARSVVALADKHPRFAAELAVLERAGAGLPGVLRGELDPTSVLSPGGSHTLLERYFREAMGYPAHLELVREAVAKAIERWPSRRALRVLQVGAATGALTEVLLPVLPAHRADFLFTDRGQAFVAAARTRFAGHPWIDYRAFAIEQDPAGQGIEVGTFDLVVAADVLGGVADPRRALSHLRACLVDGGLFVSLEPVTSDRESIVVGLLRGGRSTDPLAERGRGHQRLVDAGFGDVASIQCAPAGHAAERVTVMAVAGVGAAAAERPTARETSHCSYLVLADDLGVGDRLGKRLRALGHRVVLAHRGPAFVDEGHDRYRVAPIEADLSRLLDRAARAGDLAGVVHCWSLDHRGPDGLDPEGLAEAQTVGVLSGFHLIRGLLESTASVWFVVRDVYGVTDEDRIEGLAAAPLTGLTRVANNEAQCRFSVVDLGDAAGEEAVEHVLAELLAPAPEERETAYRDGLRRVPRLRRVRADQLPRRTFEALRRDGTVTPYRLQIDRPGVLDNLALHETPRRPPAAGEIELRVQAGGLNFRDVMKALGTYPGQPPDLRWLGDDVAGVVERVGPDVAGLRVGDRVAGMAPWAFRAYAVTDARMVFRIPAGMSFVEAATLPTAFVTAHYALRHLAALQRGERILIHAAAGGVGQAAVQIATQLGLEIFATAGTPDKRERLGELGVRHVMSSRTLDFADTVVELTGGRGVDAVLNSLAGEFVPKSLSVLAPFGRFLEIGKIDIYRNARLGLQALRNNVAFFVVDVAQHAQERPALLGRLFDELAERVEAGDYRPLPATVFPITQAAEAFRFMAQARHVGKNVLRFDVKPVPIAFSTEEASTFRADATYLITGGASGFGLAVATWMAGQGARHLALVSRGGPRDAGARRDIEALRATGVEVLDVRADVTNRDDVERAVQEVGTGRPPLRGVFHAAMVLDDDALAALDESRFQRVLAPKLAGAWNLHVATRDCPLEHFVCFSSFSAVVGGAHQSAYNAGNAFLQALAHHRRAAGRPGLAVDWGAIGGAGFVERNRKTAAYLQRVGVELMPVAAALNALDRLVRADVAQVAAVRANWTALSHSSALVATSPTYGALSREARAAESRGSLLERARTAGAAERAGLVEDFLAEQVAAVLGMGADTVERGAPLTTLGLDSLMTVELVNRVDRELGLRVPMGTLLGGPSLQELARAVLKLLAPMLDRDGPDGGTAAAVAESVARPDRDIDLVVPLRAGGDGPPLLVFHPVGGGVGIYAPLVRMLPASVPVYGIESRLMQGEEELEDLEAMVAAYVAAVRATRLRDFGLAGFSLGGYLAARVAEALERDGRPVRLVGAIEWDTRPRPTLEHQREALLRLAVATYRFLALDLDAVRRLSEQRLRVELTPLVEAVVGSPQPRTEVFLQWAIERNLMTRNALRAWAQRHLAGFGQHCAMLARQLPEPTFQAPLAVWRARRGFGSPVESWRHPGPASEHVVDGDHFAFFRAPAIDALASQLAGALARPPGRPDGVATP